MLIPSGCKPPALSIPAVLLLLAVVHACAAASAGSGPDPEVLVFVNETPITAEDLDRFLKGFYLSEEGRSRWEQSLDFERRLAKTEALQMKIDRRLLLSEAGKKYSNRRVTSYIEETTSSMASEIKQTLGSRIALIEHMHEKGITLDEWKRFQADSILIHSYLSEKISGIHIRPAEMEEYYLRNRNDFQLPKKIYFRVIHIVPFGREPYEEIRERAERVLQLIEKGKSFDQVAAQHCFSVQEGNGQNGIRVVDVPVGNPDWMPPLVRGLSPGEVSGLISRGDGYVIAKLEEIEPARVPEFGEVQHKIRNQLLQDKTAEAQRAVTKELRGSADIRLTEKGKQLIGETPETSFWQ